MPRNGSGTASVVNTFTPLTTADANQVNANFTDMANMITDSLPRDGQAGMSGQLLAISGTVGEPGISFNADQDTGIRRVSGDQVAVVCGGVDIATFSTAAMALGTDVSITFDGDGAADTRTALGLGTAATRNTGTSGANVPLLNGVNTWSATQTFATVESSLLKSSGSILSSGLSAATDFAISATPGHFLGDASTASGFSRGAGPAGAVQRNVSNGTAWLWFRATTQVGDVSVTATATTYNTSSDYRRKPVREALSGFWDRLMRVIPRRFQWDTGEWDSGFIAHEFAGVYPNAVSGEKDATDKDGKPVYQTMQAATSEVMADVMAALQDLQRRLSELENSNNS